MESVDLADGKQLPSRVVSSPLVVQFVGLPDRSGVEHVGAGNFVFLRQFMIHFSRKVILGSNLLTRKGENPGVPRPQQGAVRQRIKSLHKTQDSWINLDVPRGEVTSQGSRRRDGIHLRHAKG